MPAMSACSPAEHRWSGRTLGQSQGDVLGSARTHSSEQKRAGRNRPFSLEAAAVITETLDFCFLDFEQMVNTHHPIPRGSSLLEVLQQVHGSINAIGS